MDLNRYLPAVLTGIAALAVLGTAGLLALGWTTSAEGRLWIRRALLVLLIACIGGPALYIFMTWGVEGTPRHVIDRSMQQRQQEELQQRIQKGGH